MILRLTLPVAPSLNNLYPTNRATGKRFKAPAARDYAAEAVPRIREAMHQQQFYPADDARLGIICRVWFKTDRRDLDNSQKLVQDAIATALGIDDRQVDYIEIHRMSLDLQHPRCEVEVFIRETV
jgi:Holliday junction resolvase RusA-like endonuclease